MSSNEDLLNVETENFNSEDLERNRIKNLIKDFELEDVEKGADKNFNSQPNSPLRFALSIDNSHLREENYSYLRETPRELNYPNPENNAAPVTFDLYADNSAVADNRIVADNSIIGAPRRVSENPYEGFVNQGQGSFNVENSAVFSRADDIFEKAKTNEALRSFSLTKLESISDKDEKNALVFSYIRIITEMASELEEKRFLSSACNNNNDIAQAKVIGGVTYINYAATVYIYNMVKEDIRKNRLAAAKSGLKLICLASLDTKYVNRAINMLKDNNICSEPDLEDIINKTIEKEKVLIDTIKQLRRIISDVS